MKRTTTQEQNEPIVRHDRNARPTRKRPRRGVEEIHADCPFTVMIDKEPTKGRKKGPKRRGSAEPQFYQQLSPFTPAGRFKTTETLDLNYSVEPSAEWQEMTRYNSFILNGSKYFSEGFIYVANDASIERQRGASTNNGPKNDWVARILEIRARDEDHVYARVYWMYWPEDLPLGRLPHHGTHELIASNHMDIINVVSVTGMAHVSHWMENNEVQNALYWRQAIDSRNGELSYVEATCICGQPENPDKALVRCSNESCGKWIHDDCLIYGTLMRTYERLGEDKPYKATGDVALKKNEADDGSKNPSVSFPDTGLDETWQIDVKADGLQDNTNAGITVADAVDNDETEITAAVAVPIEVHPVAEKRSRKKRSKKADAAAAREKAAKPYLDLFSASLKIDLNPPLIEVKDLRESIGASEKSWTVPLRCISCESLIN